MMRDQVSAPPHKASIEEARSVERARLEEAQVMAGTASWVRLPMRRGLQGLFVVAVLAGMPFVGVWLEQPIENRLEAGKRDNVVHILGDGTLASLNANSWLALPERFVSNRQLRLIGEARFELHAGQGEFVVRTPRAEIAGIDAEFTVRSHPDEPTTVVVKRGSVVVRDLTTGGSLPPVTTLGAGESHTVRGTPPPSNSGVNVSNAVAWVRAAIREPFAVR